jgi:EAL domain-containing protein (putative c-di-GMP-specific phosphodiesterase class I)
MKNVGAALSHAKEGGGNNFEFYSAGMNAKALTRLSLESNLRRAIDREELIVYYQPKVDINTWQIAGAEALVRWQHSERGLISPAEFIPLAEETGLIASIDEWVLRTSCVQMKEWLTVTSRSLTLSCNISARQFQLPNFFAFIMSLLHDIRLDPKHLELELTESSVMTNPESGIRTLQALKDSGVGISIDDFGTGFSSLGYLKRLPIDTLKIDRSFVNDATTDPDDAALVMAIITLAHNLRLKVVAEGVETEEQLKFLHLLRCDEIQGYLFSKPVPADLFEELLEQELGPSNNWDALRRKLDIKIQRRQLRAA